MNRKPFHSKPFHEKVPKTKCKVLLLEGRRANVLFFVTMPLSLILLVYYI